MPETISLLDVAQNVENYQGGEEPARSSAPANLFDLTQEIRQEQDRGRRAASWLDERINAENARIRDPEDNPRPAPRDAVRRFDPVRDWAAIEREFRQEHPGVDPAQFRDAYTQAANNSHEALTFAREVERVRRVQPVGFIDSLLQDTPLGNRQSPPPGATPEQQQRFFRNREVANQEGARNRQGRVSSLEEQAVTLEAANRMASGQASEADRANVAAFIGRGQRNAEKGFWDQVLGIVEQVPGFAAELALTGGIFSAGRAVGGRAATGAITRILGERAAEGVAARAAAATIAYGTGIAAQTAALPHRYTETAARMSVPDIEAQGGQLQFRDRGNVLSNLPAAYLDTGIEVGSEHAGAALPYLGRAARRIPGVGAIAEGWAGSAPGRTLASIDRGLGRISSMTGHNLYNGVAGEMMEERLGEVLRGLTGLAVRPDGSPDYGQIGDIIAGRFGKAGENMLVEAVAFAPLAMVGLGASVRQRMGLSPQARSFQDANSWMERNGFPEEERMAGIAGAQDTIRQLASEGASQEAATRRITEQMDQGGLRDYALSLAKALPTESDMKNLNREKTSSGMTIESLRAYMEQGTARLKDRISREVEAFKKARGIGPQQMPAQGPTPGIDAIPEQSQQTAQTNIPPAPVAAEAPKVATEATAAVAQAAPQAAEAETGQTTPSKAPEAQAEAPEAQLSEVFRQAKLTPREAHVLVQRLDRTLEDVGGDFKVTRERVRQIQDKALVKLEKVNAKAAAKVKSLFKLDKKGNAERAAQVVGDEKTAEVVAQNRAQLGEITTTAQQASDDPAVKRAISKANAPLTASEIAEAEISQLTDQLERMYDEATESGKDIDAETKAAFDKRLSDASTRLEEAYRAEEKAESDSRKTKRAKELAYSAPAAGITGGLTQAPIAKVEPISNHTITATIYKAFDLPFFPDRARRKAAAVYAWLPENVWFNKDHAGNIGVATHESAHHLDKKYEIIDNLPGPLRRSMEALDYQPNRTDRKLARREGFAELARIWLTDDTTGKTIPPALRTWWEDWLDQHPEVQADYDRIRPLIERYKAQSPAQRVQANIRNSTEAAAALQTAGDAMTDAIANRWDNYLYHWVEEGIFLKRFQETIEKIGQSPFQQGSGPYGKYLAMQRMGPGYAQHTIEHGAILLSNFQPAPGAISLKEVLKDVKPGEDLQKATAYAYARHAIDAWAKGINPGISLDDATAAEADLREPRYVAYADKLTAFNNQTLPVAVDSGLLSAADATKFMQEWDTYLPLYRVRPQGSLSRPFAGTKFVDVGKFYKKRTGGDYQILDPLESSVAKLQLLYSRAIRQQIINEIDRFSNPNSPDFVEGLGAWVTQEPPGIQKTTVPLQEIAPKVLDELVNAGVISQAQVAAMGSIPAGVLNIYRPDYDYKGDQPIVRVMRNNEPAFIRLNENLHKFLSGLEHANYDGFWGVFGAATRIFKKFNTGLNPGFAISNWFKDWQSSFFQAQNQSLGWRMFGPPVELVRSLAGAVVGGQAVGQGRVVARELFEMMGASMVTRRGYELKEQRKIIDEVMHSDSLSKAYRIIRNPFRGPGEFLKGLEHIVSYGESIPRFLEFKAVLAKHGFTEEALQKGAKPPPEVLREAQVASLNVTINFNETGLYTKQLNQLIPYFSAHIRGLARTADYYKEAKNSLPRSLMDHAIYLGLVTAAWAFVKDDDWYQESDEWLKYGFITFPGARGQPAFRIPLTHGQGSLVASNWIGLLESGRKGSLSPLGDSLYHAGLDIFTPSRMGPVGAAPLTEVFFNHSFYTNRALEPRRMERIQPGSRMTNNTTAPARLLGQAAPTMISPIRVDHFMNSMTGRLWGSALNLDWMGLTGVGRLTLNSDHPRSMNAFYTELGNVERARNTAIIDSARQAGGTVPREVENRYQVLEWANRLMQDLNSPIRDVADREARFATERYTIGLARAVLGEPQLERYPNPLRSENWSGMPAEVRDSVERHLSIQIDHLADSQPRRQVGQSPERYAEQVARWQQSQQHAQLIMQLAGTPPEEMRRLMTERFQRQNAGRRLTAEQAVGAAPGRLTPGQAREVNRVR